MAKSWTCSSRQEEDIAMAAFQDSDQMLLQSRDAELSGRISRQFNVTAIPLNISIDFDGVLENRRVGDAEMRASSVR
jgi:hypothetical protein